MVTAAAQDQWRLLDVQAHDNRLHQLAHREQTLPQSAEVARLEDRLSAARSELVVAKTAAEDLRREVNKAEADVDQVRQRLARNQSRLDAGQGPAKELQAMQHELDSLRARISVLEDAELEVMERQEAADAPQGAAQAGARRAVDPVHEVLRGGGGHALQSLQRLGQGAAALGGGDGARVHHGVQHQPGPLGGALRMLGGVVAGGVLEHARQRRRLTQRQPGRRVAEVAARRRFDPVRP